MTKLQAFFWEVSFAERRCLIPASSFAEYHPTERDEKGHKIVVWFGLRGDEARPAFAFAGLWQSWKGEYRGGEAEFDCYTIVTTRPNALVKPIHPTRMPVILDPDDHEVWMSGSQDQALALTRPFDAVRMQIVYEGGKSDEVQSTIPA